MIIDILMLVAIICAIMALLMCGKLVEVAIVTITHFYPRSKFAQWAEARDYEV